MTSVFVILAFFGTLAIFSSCETEVNSNIPPVIKPIYQMEDGNYVKYIYDIQNDTIKYCYKADNDIGQSFDVVRDASFITISEDEKETIPCVYIYEKHFSKPVGQLLFDKDTCVSYYYVFYIPEGGIN